MKKKTFALLVICAVFYFSCTDDDASLYPKELKFVESQILDFKMWVGGIEVSTEGLNPEQVFGKENVEWLEEQEETEKETTYIFLSEDQLEVHYGNFYYGSEYFSRNDSIFITGFFDEPQFMCVGNRDKLTFYSGQHLAIYTHEYGTGSSWGSQGNYTTVNDILQDIEYYSELDEMGENDTIAILNTIAVFE